MTPRSFRSFCLPLSVLLISVLAACGGDDVTPPEADAGNTDAGADASTGDAGGDIDASACLDDDGDGHGAMPCSDDCDDADATRYPGNTEICDADDEDCDDATYGTDADGDTFESAACCNGADNCGADCNDALNTVNPAAAEQCNGGVDDDCDGLADAADGVCMRCADGYTGFDADCVDIDECAAGTAACTQVPMATCENTPGSFVCHCPTGYEGTGRGGGGCTDIDECDSGTHDCDTDPVAACANTIAAFTCTCPVGLIGTGHGSTGCVVRFTDLGDGTVRDNQTMLVWQQSFSAPTAGQAAAVAYCASLTAAGGGWRLPAIDELLSIADPTTPDPAIDLSFFPATPSDAFWSATLSPGRMAQTVNFYDGGRGYVDVDSIWNRARCVR